jgi:O-antigen ligase
VDVAADVGRLWQVRDVFWILALTLLLAHGAPINAGLKLNVPAAALAILVWIAPALALRLSMPWRLAAGLALGLMAYSAWAGIGSAPRLAFVVGACTWACALVLPRLALYGLGVAVALIHFCAPFLGSSVWITQRVADHSWRHRIDIWEFSGQLIAERPWLGYGFKNSDFVPGGRWLMPLTHQPADLPSYPHNVLLQIQLELRLRSPQSSRELARSLKTTKYEINNILYHQPELFEKEGTSPPMWSNKGEIQ